MKALVIIPTTNRPVVITSLRERPGLPASLVVAEGDFRSLPISSDYDKLIGAAGPLGQLTGHVGLPSHELRLSQGFETGRSWEVPVCLAHYLTSRGVTLVKTPEEADIVVWATGAVDIDLGIVKDRYYLAKKLEATLPLLERLRPDARFELFVPEGTLDGMGDPDLYKKFADAGVNNVETRTVRDAVDWIEPFLAERLGGGPPSRAATIPEPRGAEPSGSGAQRAAPPAEHRVAAVQPGGGSRALSLAGVLLMLGALAGAGWLWASGRIPGFPRSSGSTQVATGEAKPGPSKTGQEKAGSATGGQKTAAGGDQSGSAPKTGGHSLSGSPKTVTPPDPKTDGKASQKPGDGSSAAQPKVLNPTAPDAKGNAEVPGKAEEPKGGTPGETAANPAADPAGDLLVIEEQRAPAGLTCRQLAFGGSRPEIALLRPKAGRFPASDVEGLCALVFRRGPGAATFGIEIEQPLLKATLDAARYGGGGSIRAGDVGRMLRDDSRRPMAYTVILRPAAGSGASVPVRFVHELRK